jgi:hypothetical protein
MSWLGALLCALAAYRLRATPLAGAALAATVVNVTAHVTAALARARSGRVLRPLVGLKHVTAALGAFFLFVSFALP